ncbi:MFS transporter [Arachidicoccus soli]|uniref:MFS transporter n=1 Tax=Arachidicoccus soli TaxID=2341117 RepID=A0A386HQM9_9BACT|nr:MFS transporter [Arachidicoccus soli]AYD47564.1 MFS transporter [Arachidicoccus soli]
MNQNSSSKRNIILLIIVASLGYFVDIYDLLIFSIVRVKSLTDIGIPAIDLRQTGEYILNMQMAGLLLGGIVWGVMGDRYGRIKVLFGSILLYSLANICNSFVHDANTYAFVRFIAGIGLAGELGAGITLVSESMHKDKRGYGTMIVAAIGLLGVIAAKEVAQHFSWRNAYVVGGILGILLLLLRLGIFESGMYNKMAESKTKKGNLSMLFSNKKRFWKYMHCILIGMPLWFVVGILLAQSPEIGAALGAPQTLSAGSVIMFAYIGISVGDIFAGFLAQILKSRRKVILLFCLITLGTCSYYLSYKGITPTKMNWLAFTIGIGVGYWANFVTIAAEQFGTNIRATVTTTVPNFVRASLIPITWLFDFFIIRTHNIITSAYIMLFLLTIIALFSLSKLKETFSKDLNYIEEDIVSL